MTRSSYPRTGILLDYLRAAVGLGVGLVLLLSAPGSPVMIALSGAVMALFLLFAIRTLQRQAMEVTVSDEAIATTGLRSARLPWDQLRRLKLRYYGGRRSRDKGKGFMELTLVGGRGPKLRFESSLPAFEDIARRGLAAARASGASLDPATLGNLESLGVLDDRTP